MSREEVRKAEELRQIVDRVLSQRTAAAMLGLSTRQARRLLRGYEAHGYPDPSPSGEAHTAKQTVSTADISTLP